jgi:hypothetical protein
MTEFFFGQQMKRLKNRFGEKAFDAELTRLIAQETRQMSDKEFERLVEHFIGTRKHTDPPLIVHFREGRLHAERKAIEQQVGRAAETVFHSGDQTMQQYLEKLGAKNLNEAIEIERKKARLNNG